MVLKRLRLHQFLVVWHQGRNQERANRAIAPPRNFCKHDGIHVLQMKGYFSRRVTSKTFFRIRAASYRIKLLTNQCTMLPKTAQNRRQTVRR